MVEGSGPSVPDLVKTLTGKLDVEIFDDIVWGTSWETSGKGVKQ
jgi:hypothetical protein